MECAFNMERIHVSKLYTIERELIAEYINKYVNNPDFKEANIERIEGSDNFCIIDGKHRIANQILSGKNIIEINIVYDSYVLDWDKNAKLIPLLELIENFKKYHHKVDNKWIENS
jgi:hypothetical protein